MSTREKAPTVPPRWFVRAAWVVHRAIYNVTGGRKGLWLPKPNKWGTMRVTTIGRKTGQERSVILGYYEDGPNLVTMAMNGWGEGEPAWWLNLLANPEAKVVLANGKRAVRAAAATGAERDAAVGALARDGRRRRRLREAAVDGDGGRGAQPSVGRRG